MGKDDNLCVVSDLHEVAVAAIFLLAKIPNTVELSRQTGRNRLTDMLENNRFSIYFKQPT